MIDDGLEKEELAFAKILVATGDPIRAAKDSGIGMPYDTEAETRALAEKAMRDPDIMGHVKSLVAQAGYSELDIMKNMLDLAFNAEKFGIVQKTGDVVSLGADNQVRFQSTSRIMQMFGYANGPRKTERESEETEQSKDTRPIVQVVFNGKRMDDDDEDVIDGDSFVSR